MRVFEAFETNHGWELVSGSLEARCDTQEQVKRTVIAMSKRQSAQLKWYDKRGALSKTENINGW